MPKRNNRKYKVEKKIPLKSQNNVKFQVPRVKNLASRLEDKGKEK